ncbi:hypothetical protein [Shewanella maritima]|uniref:hypothetical protein n=1 Tax=Shewanella maritima TaxID=2520507 RepID=UPI0037353C4E
MEKRLTIIYRLEPGCLGPDGVDHILPFCQLINTALRKKEHPYVCWQVVARHDKSLPETQYFVAGKLLSQPQAQVYLAKAEQSLGDTVEQFEEMLTQFINHYIARK